MSNISNVSLSQATALERSLSMTAHNIANANTAGYKAIQPLFESIDHEVGAENVSFVLDRGSYLDLNKGALMPTGNPLGCPSSLMVARSAIAATGVWLSMSMAV